MIYSLNGKLLESTPGHAVIECGGVGYEVSMPVSSAAALPPAGETVRIYAILNVTENDVALYGFLTQDERRMFKMLTGVSGVGPKAGLSILSALSCDRIVLAVASGDAKAFTAANGVGPKLGQRIVLELKEKVSRGFSLNIGREADQIRAASSESSSAKAIEALCSLGYSQSEAALAVSSVDPSLPVGEMIRLALRSVAGKVR